MPSRPRVVPDPQLQELARVSVNELTLRQVRDIELGAGLPMSRWTDGPSMADVLARIYAAGIGMDLDEVLDRFTVGQLLDLVDMGDEGPPDPTEGA